MKASAACRPVFATVLPVILLSLCAGCQLMPDFYREDGPSVTMHWETPTTADIKAEYEPATARDRGWKTTTVLVESGAVDHYPQYFEDPFVDKGHGRTDETHPHNVYRLGWEDWIAFPYGLSRFTLNWLLFPVSAAVTPPWTTMQSDGELSKQFLGYDHDAAPVEPTWLGAPTAAEGKAGRGEAREPEAEPVAEPKPVEPPAAQTD